MDQNPVSMDEHTHFTFEINHLSGILLFYCQNISETPQLCLTAVDPTTEALDVLGTTFNLSRSFGGFITYLRVFISL